MERKRDSKEERGGERVVLRKRWGEREMGRKKDGEKERW